MSAGPKSGSCRIPTFGSRIPQIAKPGAPSDEITANDIGKTVRVGEKEGTLRFVGGVHFAKGIWCGIELTKAIGKNDGSVNGVRYFTCSALHGLMAPQSKVTLIQDNCESLHDTASGPYSMLFLDATYEISKKNKRTNDKNDLTFSEAETSTPTDGNFTFTLPLNKSCESLLNETSNEVKRRRTTLHFDATFIKDHSTPARKFRTEEDASNKRDSLECEESLGILTPDQMVDFVQSRSSSLDYKPNLNSPRDEDDLNTDHSLGIIDDHVISNATFKTDTMELPLEMKRCEETPSPEELPLDTTPVVKTVPKGNCFVTSITSITSLDTGYQGDGEMSRPASRGGDNSPLTRRPLPMRTRVDPMTDSDFYTESDADNHEENHLKGDRKAQVIDGTLYGVDVQAAEEIYANNKENMDSSGIFTDIERENVVLDVSPSDTSSKTVSDNSQEILEKTVTETPQKENPKKRNAPSPAISTVSSPRHDVKEENAAKKYKMPKRDVQSKVKAMIEPRDCKKESIKTPKNKPVGRWDAVMDKITKNDKPARMNLKEVKSRVFNSVSTNVVVVKTRNNEVRMGDNAKPRRIRTRTALNATPTKNGSNHSSLSDVSGSVSKKTPCSAKKKEPIQVTQVLTANKLSPRNQQQHRSIENKKNATNLQASSSTETKAKWNIYTSKEKKTSVNNKECGKTPVKGGRASPTVRPPSTPRAPPKQPPQRVVVKDTTPKSVEALAVLVHHLVFNVEAYQVPKLRRENERLRKEYDEVCKTLSEERSRSRKEIDEHRNQINQLTRQQGELQERLQREKDDVHRQLTRQHEEQLRKLTKEFGKLQKSHEEALEILREENEAIRKQIDEERDEIQRANHESVKLEKDYESKEEVQSLRAVLELKQTEVAELRRALGEATQKLELLVGAEERAAALNARCEDLQWQLQRKSEYEQGLLQENARLQESFKDEMNQKRRLSQHNEELQWKLKQNKEVFNKVMEQAEETVFNRSILSSSFNERHSSTKSNLERTLSFRERSFSNRSNCSLLEVSNRSRKSKTSSEVEMEDLSPPTSPKVKGVVEKSDSVSYVLDLDESPDVVASRIVRRSFRNSTPPKNTPTKSPHNKRPRFRNPLSLSASSSAIVVSPKVDSDRPHSANARNGVSDVEDNVFLWTNQRDYDDRLNESCESNGSSLRLEDHLDLDEDNEDLPLPALPSEMDRKNGVKALPTPINLASESSVICESNSEDETSSSSQL